jgi:hypothetical protein
LKPEEIIMNGLQGIDVFNIVMGLGIVVLLLAIRDIDRSNGVLRDRNRYERERDKGLFPELDCRDECRGTHKNGR